MLLICESVLVLLLAALFCKHFCGEIALLQQKNCLHTKQEW